MPKSALTGSRIRERRLQLSLRQSALARTVGISATYLNLIEHNKRRIGGKLLIDLSHELLVDPSSLTEGAEAELLEALRDAAAGRSGIAVEMDQVEDMAGRFPGWAGLLAAQQRQIIGLEQTAEALTDRLTHDPHLASSLHEVLSVVTAIRSTSAILAGTDKVDPEWQARFHRNMYEDSQRLAQSSQALVEYLDATSQDETDTGLTLPQEELETWLAERDFHIEDIEGPGAMQPEALMQGSGGMSGSNAAMAMALDYLGQYQRDANVMPLAEFSGAMEELNFDPAALATRFRCDLAQVFRRMAAMPTPKGAGRIGLVQCDGSGTLTHKKAVDGFALPRFGAACPLWPLYQALARPMSPIRHVVEQSGRTAHRFLTYAVSQPAASAGFDMPQVFQSTMLILPGDRVAIASETASLPIGTSCRICPRAGCIARREPSILTEGF